MRSTSPSITCPRASLTCPAATAGLVEHADQSSSLPASQQRQLLDHTLADLLAVEARLEPDAVKRQALEAESKRLALAGK